jgi:NTP pyrophosphatase (non-canonical NTP hydrolase)
MDIKEIEQKITQVSDIYADRFNIKRDQNWYFYKLIEEVGEMTKAYNDYCGRGRNPTTQEMQQHFKDELADVFAHLILFTKAHDIDIETAIMEKWFKWL